MFHLSGILIITSGIIYMNAHSFISAACLPISAIVLFSCISVQRSRRELPPIEPISFVEVNEVRLHYHRSSKPRRDRPTLLLVHGFGASHQVWQDIFPDLSAEFPSVRIDLKGFGFSEKPDDYKYSPHDHAELVTAFLRQLPDKHIIIIAHSYGAGVAILSYLELLQDPDARNPVIGFVLIDAAIAPQDFPFFVDSLRNPLTRFIAENFTTPEWRSRHVLERIFFDKSKVTKEHVRRYAFFLRLDGAERALRRVANQIELTHADDLVGQLNKITVPVLLIWGANDPAIPVTQGALLAEELPRAELRILPKTGHAPHEERPQATLDLILPFLERFKRE